MLVIGLIPTLVVSVIAYLTISKELTRKTIDQLVSTASKQEQKINGLLQAKQEEAIKLTNRFDLQSALERYVTSGGKNGGQDMYNILFSRKVETPSIQNIYVTDISGTVAASTITGGAGQKLTPEDYFVEPDEESTITLKKDPNDDINKLYITSNVRINKKEAGYLTVIFRIDDIVAAVQDYTGLGSTGETVVSAQDKNKVAISLFPLRFDTDAALQKNLNSLQLFNTATTPNDVLIDYRGKPVLVAPLPIGFANWVIATKIDKKEVLTPITQLRSALLSIVLVLSLATILVAFYLGRFFTRPIVRIAEVSERIGKGDFSARSELTRSDEIGALSTSINAMGLSLKEFVAHIESQRRRLEIILNSTEESILAIDKKGVIIIANQATALLAKRPLNRIVGKPFNDIFSWYRNSQPFSVDYDKPGTHTYSDMNYIDTEGITRYVKLIVTRTTGEQEDTAQAIITVHDETKSRELENMKVDFVSMAAHELRTPLAAIRGYIELISYKISDTAGVDVKKYLDQSLKSTTELGGLITNLLDVTRIERGSLVLNFTKVDLAADLQQAIRNVSFNAQEKQITLKYEGPVQGSPIIADQIGLHEVINNLLSNAIKYTEPHGNIYVSLVKKADHYIVTIKDSGIGIPKRALPNLFTKFYRVHGGLNSGSTGTGLGLFIAKSIIERHGGTISVDSEEGVGSTFNFTIPILDEARLAVLQAESQQSSLTNIRKKRGWITQNITR